MAAYGNLQLFVLASLLLSFTVLLTFFHIVVFFDC
jgi:hypothetical protein